MPTHENHDKIIEAAKNQFQAILADSGNSIYIYLDDTHKLANKNFVNLLEYPTEEEWASVDKPFTETFVDLDSQHTLVHAYTRAMEEMVASKIQVSWKTKTGKTVNTNVIIVPIGVMGELLALHFIEKI